MQLQNEMRRQQTLQSLNMELSSLMMRIQQVQYGGGSFLGAGGSIGGGFGTGIGGSIGGGVGFGIGGSIGGGVNYNGGGSYLFNPGYGTGYGSAVTGGGTGCVGLSCSPTTRPGVPGVGAAATGR